MPVELIDDNGIHLKEIVLRLVPISYSLLQDEERPLAHRYQLLKYPVILLFIK